METMIIGIDPEQRAKVAQGLKHLLADSYTLYLQTQNFHMRIHEKTAWMLRAMLQAP